MDVVRTVLPVAVVLVIGMICRSRNLISREGIDTMKSVAVNICLPAVLLGAFATTKYTWIDICVPLIMFLVCMIAWGAGYLARKIFGMSSKFIPFLTTGFEAGMLGYALFTMLYGSERTAEFARVDLGQVLFVFTLYKVLLGTLGENRPEPKALAKEMLASPIIIAIIAGVLLGATGLYELGVPSGASGVLDACTDFVAAPTSVLILLGIGYDLVLKDVPWGATIRAVALRFAIMMLLRTVLVLVLDAVWPEIHLTAAINVMFILPPPFVLPVFADDAEQRVYVSSVLSVSTLAAIAGFGVLAALG